MPSRKRCFWHQFGQFPEVLGRCCELELFSCTFGFSQSHHPQSDVSFEMGKQHLDFAPFNERGHVSVGLADIARDVSCRFMNGPHEASAVVFRAALRFQRTCLAIVFGGAVSDEAIFATVGLSWLGELPAICLQHFAVWACVFVDHIVIGEVFAGECAISSFGFVPDRDVRGDLPAVPLCFQHRASGSHLPGSGWHQCQSCDHQPAPHPCNAAKRPGTYAGTNHSRGNDRVSPGSRLRCKR